MDVKWLALKGTGWDWCLGVSQRAFREDSTGGNSDSLLSI